VMPPAHPEAYPPTCRPAEMKSTPRKKGLLKRPEKTLKRVGLRQLISLKSCGGRGGGAGRQ